MWFVVPSEERSLSVRCGEIGVQRKSTKPLWSTFGALHLTERRDAISSVISHGHGNFSLQNDL